MHLTSLTPPFDATAAAVDVREAAAPDLALALRASRADTLATFSVWAAALGDGRVPQQATLNPPAWELGHIGWFQEFWIGRNPERDRGAAADPDVARRPASRDNADALYDSGRVPHASRWTLPLPDLDATRSDLGAQLDRTLALLAEAAANPEALYFYRLALLHEDMHHEAALYMAQSLGIAIDDPRWQTPSLPEACRALVLDAGTWTLGSRAGVGFAFDNELASHPVALPASRIDDRVVRWDEYLAFVEAGGYERAGGWSAAGWAWRVDARAQAPRYLRRAETQASGWEQWRHGQWSPLDPAQPACYLTWFEVDAWCRWAGRRLPTEGEWERAALQRPAEFRWGQVWEWTASPFTPYPGFAPHPYRDYSAPWFDNRPVLRGASFMTQPRMRHPRYRNFFLPHRNDIAAGFRTCRD